jgi:putative ABC transport system permease protein
MKNLQFTIRLLSRNPLLVFVNIPGLAVGLSVVLLLLVYLEHELSFDQHFETKERVLRLNSEVSNQNGSGIYGISLRDAYTVIPDEVPEVEAATQLFRWLPVRVKSKTEIFSGMKLLFADPGFFEVFGLDLITGDEATALSGKNKVVLSSSTAKKIFGTTECVGEILNVSEEEATVSGVIRDLPETTHFNFDLLGSMETVNPDRFGGLEFFTYFLIRKNADIKEAGKKISRVNDQVMVPWSEPFGSKVRSFTEPLSEIHLHTKVTHTLSPKADLTQLWIIGGIAFFILLLAVVNFVNLYFLHGEERITEVASRKALGAGKWSIEKLFLFETGLIGLSSFVLALIIAFLVQPYFSMLMRSSLELSRLFSWSGVLFIAGLVLLFTLISGFWSSFYLSRVNIVNGLRGKTSVLPRKGRMTIAAVLIQFSVTVFLITAVIVVQQQVKYMKNVPVGFDVENVLEITGFNSQIAGHIRSIEDELTRLSFIEGVACSHHQMGGGASGQGIRRYGDTRKYASISEYRVQPGFCKTLGLRLIDGNYFSGNENSGDQIILNEAAVEMLQLKNPVGTLLQMHNTPLKVAGVVSNFFFSGYAGEPVSPLVITTYDQSVEAVYLRINKTLSQEDMSAVEKVLQKYDPEYVPEYTYLEKRYADKFSNEERAMKLVTAGAILAIIISFVGLLALSVFNVNRRTKEIGIRKVLGSTERQVVTRLLSDTIKWVLVAIAIAFVADIAVMRQWLTQFASRISLHPGYFLVSAIFALIIAFTAIAWQSYRAAVRNPVESLRDE